MLKLVDTPPVWLVGFIALAYLQYLMYPTRISVDGAWPDFLGGLFVGGGVILTVLALYEMRRQRTSFRPRDEARALVTTGIFARSRNPIYLGYVLILTGFILKWEAAYALAIIPVFIWILEERFIMPEELAMRDKFDAEFKNYVRKTRRWV